MTPKKRTVKRTASKRAPAAANERRPPARPTTQRQIIDRLLDAVSVQRGPTSFVQLERSPRGQVVISVTVHQGGEPGLDTIAATEKRATELFDKLCRKYPVLDYGN